MWPFDGLDNTSIGLINKNILWIRGGIDSQMLLHVQEAFARILGKEGYPDVTVFITSEGGDLDFALQICDLIKAYPGRVTGIAHGSVRSSAAIILQACTVRLATPATRIKIHPLMAKPLCLTTLENPDKMRKLTENLRRLQDEVCQIFAEKCKKTAGEIWALMVAQTEMSAKTALENGLIDGLVLKLPLDGVTSSGDVS